MCNWNSDDIPTERQKESADKVKLNPRVHTDREKQKTEAERKREENWKKFLRWRACKDGRQHWSRSIGISWGYWRSGIAWRKLSCRFEFGALNHQRHQCAVVCQSEKMGQWAPFPIHSRLLKGLAWKSKNASTIEPVNMRPGPRLVVMVALAFILGAQSSTDQQQSQNNLQQISNIDSSNGKGKLLSKRDESARENEASSAATAAALFFDSILSKVNPWLSACDLAQPKTAPDLQVSRLKLSNL